MQNTHNVFRVRLCVVEDDKQSRLKEKSYATRRQNANVHWGFSSSWLRTYLHPSTTTSQKEVVCFAHDEEELLLQLAVLDGRARKLEGSPNKFLPIGETYAPWRPPEGLGLRV